MKAKRRIISFALCFTVIVSAIFIGTLMLATANTQTVLDISKGDIHIGNGVVSGFDQDGNSVSFDEDGYRIVGTTQTNVINIFSADTVNITLDNVVCRGVASSCLDICNTTVNLTLVGDSILETHQDHTPQNAVYMDIGGRINVSGDGSLRIHGSSNYYGGGPAIEGGNLTLNGGTVTLIGGNKIQNDFGECFGGGLVTVNAGTLNCYQGELNSSLPGKMRTTGLTINADGTVNVGTIALDLGGGINTSGTLNSHNTIPGNVSINGGCVTVENGAFSLRPTLSSVVNWKVTANNSPVLYNNINNQTYTDSSSIKIEACTAHEMDYTGTITKVDDTNHKGYCKWCNYDNVVEAHTGHYTYSASDNNVIADCICDHSLTAQLKLKADADLTYTGSAITPMEMEYPASWPGTTNQPTDADYSGNIHAGTASCTFAYKSGVVAVQSFNIAKRTPTASMFDVTLPNNAVYNGGPHYAGVVYSADIGSIAVKYNGSTSVPTDAGAYVVTVDVVGNSNYNSATGIVLGGFIVDELEITLPTITGKVYNGAVQTADITGTGYYTVEENNGGTHVGSYDVVLKLTDSVNYKWNTTNDISVTLEFVISKAGNTWNTMPYVGGWTYGDVASVTNGEAKFGTATVVYTGTDNNSVPYNSSAVPTNAGNYTATFTVEGTTDYEGLSKQINFSIDKATYDMSGATWDYNGALQYTANEQKVEVIGLPAGVTVESYTCNTATDVGNYTAEVTLSYDSCNYIMPTINNLDWKIENNWDPTEYVLSGEGWLNSDLIITPANGYKISVVLDGSWADAVTGYTEGASSEITFYLKDEATGAVSLPKTIFYRLDKTPATGEISFSTENSWTEFVEPVSFGLFYKNEVTVAIEGTDGLSGINSIEYFISESGMSLADVKAHTNWTAYNVGFTVALEDEKQFVCYARIKDNAGNTTYVSTNGAEYDITAPVISGVENGKVYYTTQKVTVTDKNIDTVTLNGDSRVDIFMLSGNTDKEYVIVATDKANNSSTVTVTMKPVSAISAPIDSITEGNVKSTHESVIDEVKSNVDAVDTTNATNEEKEALNAIKDKITALKQAISNTKSEISRIDNALAQYDDDAVKSTDKEDIEELADDTNALLEGDNLSDAEKTLLQGIMTEIEELIQIIEDAADALDTENIESVKDITSENVTAENKDSLEKAQEELEKALADNAGKYTDEEIDTAEDKIKRIEDALKAIDNAEAVEKMINDLPEVITKEDEEAIKAARNAYNALTENEKSIAGNDAINTLIGAEAALDALNNPNIDSPNTGDSSHILLYLALVGISLLAVIALVISGRKEEA
ncbi:MAG: hypothetical protein E7315_05930 [Clostridiales bacterium]|nr:hypothetical protein [Clostridiales bacterium]